MHTESHFGTARFCSLVFSLALIAGTAMAGNVISTQSGDWGTGATWGGSAPGPTDDVFIAAGHAVTNSGLDTVHINSLSVSGILAHADNSSTEANKIILDITNDCTIAVGGKIDVTGLGYNVNYGPGLSSTAYAGGSYGGRGGYNGNTADQAGATYGSLTSPTNCGSGGKTAGTSGGGAIQITAGGTTTVNGGILANGQTTAPSTSTYGGGAGGSVFITTANFGGSGSVTANGGVGGDASSHGAGGGGRVSVVLTSGSTFGSVDLRADRGAGTADTGGSKGYSCAGTVYTKTPSQPYGTVKVDNSGKGLFAPATYITPGTRIPAGDTWQVDAIELVNGGTLWIDDTSTLIVSNTTGSTTNGYLINEGTLSVPTDFVVSNVTFMPLKGSTFDGTNLTIHSSAVVTHIKNSTTEAWSLELSIPGDLTIPADAAIDVDGKGYAPRKGPGTILPGQQYRSGGSYGGRGGFAKAGTAYEPPGYPYGSITSPTNSGSGGGYSVLGQGNGGGAIKLTVDGTTSVAGTISANGINFGGTDQGGGSGGSVWLTTGSLTGSGAITANGGLGDVDEDDVAGGGGGRIAVYLTGSSSFGSVNIQAYGGTNVLTPAGEDRYDGAAGTVYLQTQDQAANRGTLIVANRGVTGEDPIVTTMINTNVSGTTVGDVRIDGKATLKLTNNVTFTVYGSWSNGYAFTAVPGTTVKLAGTNEITLFGSSAFDSLVCTNVSRQINFEADETTAVDASLTFTGPSDTSLVLRSTSPGTQWNLDVDGATVVDVTYVDVQDSDATNSGVTVSFSEDSGNNSNWNFSVAGQTNIWLGGNSDSWIDDLNWSLGNPPTPTDGGVVISNGTYDPALPSAKTFQNLEVWSGAELSLGGFDLTVDGDTSVAGTLTATGSETITLAGNLTVAGTLTLAGTETVYVGGNLDLSAGTFTKANSHVILDGTAAQTVTSDGKSFTTLTVSNQSALVTFADAAVATTYYSRDGNVTYGGNFDATEFHVYSDSGAITQTFAASSTYTFERLWLHGSTGKTQHLESAGTWNLDVTGMAYVQHVDVKYSDAVGNTIIPFLSKDSGNNNNWAFGGPFAVWTGGSGSSFDTAGSWDPPGVPDGSTYILVDSATTLTVGSPASVMYAMIGGDSSPLMEINSSFTAGQSVDVIDGGTLEINDDPGMTVSNDVYVAPGGVVNHNDNSTTEADRMVLTVKGDLTIASGGAINVTGLGYNGGQGPGKATISYSGGSYGGVGGLFEWATSRDDAPPTYGSYSSPTNLGSGGVDSPTPAPGGGAVQLNVAGTTTVNGKMLAEGQGGSYAGGAGGSIFLTTASLAGSGTISANGGHKLGDENHGAGGGGRVAVILTNSSSFGSVAITAEAGGAGSNHSRGDDGMPSAGTIYTWVPGQTYGTLKVDAGGDDRWEEDALTLGTKIPDGQTWQVDRLELVNGGTLFVEANTTLNLASGDFGNSETSGSVCVFGTMVLPTSLTISNVIFMPHGDNTLSGLSNLTVADGGLVTHLKNNNNTETYGLEIDIPGNLTVDAGGKIDVTANGYGRTFGPGAPSGTYNGAAHGGAGGSWNSTTFNNADTYGSVLAPTNAGSGGGSSGGLDTDGGGIIRLMIGGATTVNGEILADGGSSLVPSGYNGGSGGSIYLTTATLSGAGTIRAGGGDPGGSNTGAGGGGRVSVVLTSGNTFGSVELSARGGTVGGTGASGPGTVYLEAASDGTGGGRVLVDCKGEDSLQTAVLPPETLTVADELVDVTLIVTNANTKLTLTNNLTVGDILVYTDADLILGSYTMYVNSVEHHIDDASQSGPGGPTNTVVDYYHQIVWQGANPGMVIILR